MVLINNIARSVWAGMIKGMKLVYLAVTSSIRWAHKPPQSENLVLHI